MNDKVVSLVARSKLCDEAAPYLRELADRIEAGEITDLVIVSHDSEGPNFERYSDFTDRWRILGALEYAKDAIHRAG